MHVIGQELWIQRQAVEVGRWTFWASVAVAAVAVIVAAVISYYDGYGYGLDRLQNPHVKRAVIVAAIAAGCAVLAAVRPDLAGAGLVIAIAAAGLVAANVARDRL